MNSFLSVSELLSIGFKSIGNNVLISRYAQFYSVDKISIGDNVRIDDFCILSGKITLCNNIHISAYTALYGGNTGIVMYDFSGISAKCVVYAESDDYSGMYMINPMNPMKYRHIISGQVVINKHVQIGAGCVILPNVTVGEGVAVGSMSLVRRSLDPWGIYVGIPCKKIKDRDKNVLILEKQYLEMK